MHDRNQVDRGDLVRRAQEVKDGITRLTDDLGKLEATGLSGGGLVRATVAGDGTLVALDLDPAVVIPEDPGALAGLVIAAVNDAIAALNTERASQVAPMTASVRDILTRLRENRESQQ